MSDLQIPMARIAPFALRLQPEVKAKLLAAAAISGRSLNAELCLRLVESLQDDGPTLEDRVAAIELHIGLAVRQ